MNNEQKKEILLDLIKEIYTAYLKSRSIYDFIIKKYGKDINENVNKIEKRLVRLRKEAKRIPDNDKKRLTEVGVEIAELDGRTDFISKKKEELEKATSSVDEYAEHYKTLLGYLNNSEFEKNPEVIKK